jgi:hypothetical protein
MGSDGSEKEDGDEPKRARPGDPLPDTADLPPPPPRPKTPGFVDEPRPRIDPWTEVTPPQESTSPEVETYDAEYTVAGTETDAGSTAARDDLIDPEPTYDDVGADGPVAAPLDGPSFVRASAAEQRFAAALRDDSGPKRQARTRSISELQRVGFGAAPFTAPLQVEPRNAPKKAAGERALVPRRSSAVGLQRQERSRPKDQGRSQAQAEPVHGRRYPKMRALLKNPDEVPHGSEPIGRAKMAAPPVPGTFFPAPRKEREPPQGASAPADLDEMLAAMAEGLLVGDDGSGGTEVRVTLRDEFFAGTELRIRAGGGKVRAVLVPPDRSTYLALNGNLSELRARLEARGLKVEELRVAEP